MGNLTVNAHESLLMGYFKRTSFLLHSEVSALVWVWCLHIVGDDPTCDGVVRHDGGYLRPDARVLTHPDRQLVSASPWRPLKVNVTGCGSDVNEYRYWNKTQTCIITNASRLIIFNSKLIIRLQQMCFCVAFFWNVTDVRSLGQRASFWDFLGPPLTTYSHHLLVLWKDGKNRLLLWTKRKVYLWQSVVREAGSPLGRPAPPPWSWPVPPCHDSTQSGS